MIPSLHFRTQNSDRGYINNETLEKKLNEYFKPFEQSFSNYIAEKNALREEFSNKQKEAMAKVNEIFEKKKAQN